MNFMACAANASGLVYAANEIGEVAEWPKAHAWKVCNGQLFEGSTPSLTATFVWARRLNTVANSKLYKPEIESQNTYIKRSKSIAHFLSRTKLIELHTQLWWLYRFPRNNKQ